jgi:hypothetical protein
VNPQRRMADQLHSKVEIPAKRSPPRLMIAARVHDRCLYLLGWRRRNKKRTAGERRGAEGRMALRTTAGL